MSTKDKDSSLTFMTPWEFSRIAEKLCGPRWQGILSEHIGYSRQHIGLFSNGLRPIPALVASHLRILSQRRDDGIPILAPEAVGRIIEGGFAPLATSPADESE